MHVFYVRAGDDAGSDRLPVDIEELTVPNRIRAALARRRNRGQQVIEMAVTSLKPPDAVTLSVIDFTQKSFRVAESNSR